ncbi:Mitogen-activated protein kinase cpk1 [Trebouxia sp. C0009 RCD-2024]
MTPLAALQCCCGAKVAQVHAAGPLEEEHELALQAAEALLVANAQHKVIDLYTLAAPVGHGAFAKVVECSQMATNVKYACKILPGKTTQGDRRNHIIKEIAIMQRVGQHPYTLTFHDAFEDAGNFYLIMELCTGGELFDQIMHRSNTLTCGLMRSCEKHYSEKEAAELMRCLIEFLAFMHSKGLLHRDLKPENILLSGPAHGATIKIIDFGTADFCPAHQRLFHKFGTPLYVAPEVLGKSGHQCRCDIWSAGVIMYILLVGYPPFGGSSDQAILRRVRKGQYTFTGPNWDSVSEDAKHCIKRMLLMKPSSRATASELLEEKWFKHASAVSDKAFGQHMMRQLQGFAAMSQMRRLTLLLLARTFPDKDVLRLKEAFWQMDKDRDGNINPSELRQALLRGAVPVPPEAEFQALFNATDMDKSGYIDYVEFVATMLDTDSVTGQENILQHSFAAFDADKDGLISEQDLADVSHQKGLHCDLNDISRMIQDHDSNRDGKIDFQEFKVMIQGSATRAVQRAASVPAARTANLGLGKRQVQPITDKEVM